jgi:hypothetical protein
MTRIAQNVILDTINKQYKVVDDEGFVLETGNYYEDDMSVEKLCEEQGLRLGISTYLVSVLFL